MKIIIKKILFIGLIITGLYFLIIKKPDILVIFSDHPDIIIIATTLSAFNIVVQAFNFLQLLGHPTPPPLSLTSKTWALSGLTNYLGPFQPGLAVRLIFFKNYGIVLRQTLGTTFQQLQLSTWAGLWMFIIALLFNKKLPFEIVPILAITALAWPRILGFSKRIISTPVVQQKLSPITISALLGSLHIPPIKRMWPFVAQYLFVATSIYIVYRDFGASLSMSGALIIATSTTLSTLLALTPSNLGIQELILGYSAHLSGLSTNDAINIALLFRLSHITSCLLIYAFIARIPLKTGQNNT